jgi:hypothetical protein
MGLSNEGVFTLTATSYPNGVIQGSTSEPINSIFEESSTQEYHLGTKLVYDDGRVFRYAKNGGTGLSKALMTTSEALYGNASSETQSTYGTSATVGSRELELDVTTGGTWVENEYADGFLINSSGTATCIGDFYKIVANQIDSSDDTLMRVLLETPVRTVWDASSVITLVKSAWRDVDVMPTTAEGTPAGVPLIDVTANYYCWLQTGGYAPLIVDTSETVIKGEPVGAPGTANVAGACGDMEADTDAVWGICVFVAAAAAAAVRLGSLAFEK